MHPGHFTMTTGGLRKKLEEGSTEQVTLEEATAEATHILADVATPAYRASLSNNPLLVAQRISQIAVDLREAAPGGIPIQVWVLQTGDGCQPGLRTRLTRFQVSFTLPCHPLPVILPCFPRLCWTSSAAC